MTKDSRSIPSLSALKAGCIRLNKAIAATGFCSRRKADEYIFSGRVIVNNNVETNPARNVNPTYDILFVDGHKLEPQRQFTYVLLNKPVQVVCTLSDPQGRQTILDLLPEQYRHIGVYPVGRLDYFSEGLLLLTNDGQLAQRLMHPRHHQKKIYDVLVRGYVSMQKLQTMRNGMRLAEGEDVAPIDVDAVHLPSGDTRLRMVLRQGVNRQIRRMCRDLDLTILRLRRVAQGMLRLGSLSSGEIRQLTSKEKNLLLKSVGLVASLQ